jgi:hypothetical protein
MSWYSNYVRGLGRVSEAGHKYECNNGRTCQYSNNYSNLFSRKRWHFP